MAVFPAVALILMPTLCYGQAGRAELFGTIKDPAGLPVPKAKVVAEDQATMARYASQCDPRGEYHILGLPAGEYVLTVEQPGFHTYRQSGIILRLGGRTSLDLILQVGQPSQSIDVTAAAPLLQTASGEVSLNVDEKKIATLPLDGRNFIPLVTLSPGVALPNGQFLPRINGSRPRTNEYIYDGVSVLQPEPGQVVYYPIIDGMEEFKVNINAYSPEYGRSNGGTVMVIGKSGSNEFHGSLFEFFRNEALNARNLFAQPGPKPEFRRNQYGGTIGGPIQTNRTFFFADWQGTRLRTGRTRFSVVPTLAQRQGIFTQPIFDPATSPRTRFPNDTIPASRFDPVGAQVLQHYPLPNISGANNYVRTATEPDNQDQADFRVDRYFGQKHRIFGRYTFLRDDDTPVTPLPEGSGSLTSGVIGHAITRGDAIAGDYNWTLSPTALNQFRFGYSRRDLDQTSLQNGGIAVPGLPANSFASVLPIFTVAGFQQVGPTTAANSNFTTSITEFLDTFTLVRRRHTLKFGTDIRREALDVLNPPNPTGSFGFSTTGTNSAGVSGSRKSAGLPAPRASERVHHRHTEERDTAPSPYRRVLHRRRLEGYAAPDPEHRHAVYVELSFHGAARPGGDIQSEYTGTGVSAHGAGTGMLRLRAARRACIPPRRHVGGALRLRNDLFRAIGNHDAVHDPAVSVCADGRPTVPGQRERRIHAGERTVRSKSRRRIPIPVWGRAYSASTGTTGQAIRSSGILRCRRRSGATGTWRRRISARRTRGSAFPTRTSINSPRNTWQWDQRS